jgi:hypothetical protein
LSFGVRAATAMENQFNAVERIEEFTQVQHEPAQLTTNTATSRSDNDDRSSNDGISLQQVQHLMFCMKINKFSFLIAR